MSIIVSCVGIIERTIEVIYIFSMLIINLLERENQNHCYFKTVFLKFSTISTLIWLVQSMHKETLRLNCRSLLPEHVILPSKDST